MYEVCNIDHVWMTFKLCLVIIAILTVFSITLLARHTSLQKELQAMIDGHQNEKDPTNV